MSSSLAPRADPGPVEGGSDLDFEAIESAVMETARGRSFLAEYARRQRRAETETILAALDALGRAIQQQQSVARERQGVARPFNASARFTPCFRAAVRVATPSGELSPGG